MAPIYPFAGNSEKTESNEISFRLNSGISIIEARDEEEVISKKIIVR